MPALLTVVALLEVVVAVVLYRRWQAMTQGVSAPSSADLAPPRARSRRSQVRMAGDPLRLTLDLEAADPKAPTITRLANEAAVRALSDDATVDEVIVSDRAGVVILRLGRPEPLAERPDTVDVSDLTAPARSRTPRVVRAPSTRHPSMSRDIDLTDLHVEGRPLAQAFDLPKAVLKLLTQEDNAVELLRAILDAAGLDPAVNGDVLLCGKRAVVVIGPDLPHSGSEALSRAYLHFTESGARTGVAVSFAYLDPTDVRRRELLDPKLQHVSRVGVQRMADAVAVGADPLAFAAGPVLVRD